MFLTSPTPEPARAASERERASRRLRPGRQMRPVVILAMLAALSLMALGCGSDGTEAVATGDGGGTPIPVEPDGGIGDGGGTPIPVEPDGGIGDGAEPLPGVPTAPADGDWHGAELAETNCPGTTFRRVEASAFSFSVPVGLTDQEALGIDSEVGLWSDGGGLQVSYDYGWYTGPLTQFPGIEITDIDYSGITGQLGVARRGVDGATDNVVGVYFPQVSSDADQWNALGLIVFHDDPADEIVGRCIVGSIEWTAPA